MAYHVGLLSIQHNDRLETLAGLEGVVDIEEYLRVRTNQSLTSLVGLKRLQSIGGSLRIECNPLSRIWMG